MSRTKTSAKSKPAVKFAAVRPASGMSARNQAKRLNQAEMLLEISDRETVTRRLGDLPRVEIPEEDSIGVDCEADLAMIEKRLAEQVVLP